MARNLLYLWGEKAMGGGRGGKTEELQNNDDMLEGVKNSTKLDEVIGLPLRIICMDIFEKRT